MRLGSAFRPPLHVQALNDSSLGEAVIGGGIDDELRQPIFSLGLKGVKPEDADKVRCGGAQRPTSLPRSASKLHVISAMPSRAQPCSARLELCSFRCHY
eukprot:363131-Chlamydomonas_euryale.AAC.5